MTSCENRQFFHEVSLGTWIMLNNLIRLSHASLQWKLLWANVIRFLCYVNFSQLRREQSYYGSNPSIDPLHDPVTWYGINYAGTQVTQWDFQNKGNRNSPARLSFVLEVPLRNLRPSVINSVPCDRILQRAYCSFPCISVLTERSLLKRSQY